MKNLLLTIYIIFSINACNAPQDERLQSLALFMLKHFNHKVNKHKSIYLFIPGNQCENCIHYNSFNIKPDINDNLYIVTSLSKNYFKKFKNVIYDDENILYDLALIDYSNTLIEIEDNKIVSLKNYVLVNDELIKFCN